MWYCEAQRFLERKFMTIENDNDNGNITHHFKLYFFDEFQCNEFISISSFIDTPLPIAATVRQLRRIKCSEGLEIVVAEMWPSFNTVSNDSSVPQAKR